MFHIELRMGVDEARAYNLDEEQLHSRFLTPLTSGQVVSYGDKEWIPEKTRVIIYEAPHMRPDQIGMGRGWPSVQKRGENVTERMLASVQRVASHNAALEPLKQRLLGRLSVAPVSFREVLVLAAEMSGGARFSEQAAAAELAVWELLNEAELVLESDGQPVPQTEWQWLLRDHRAWLGEGAEVQLTR